MLQTCTSFSVSVSSFVKLMPSSKVTFPFQGLQPHGGPTHGLLPSFPLYVPPSIQRTCLMCGVVTIPLRETLISSLLDIILILTRF